MIVAELVFPCSEMLTRPSSVDDVAGPRHSKNTYDFIDFFNRETAVLQERFFNFPYPSLSLTLLLPYSSFLITIMNDVISVVLGT